MRSSKVGNEFEDEDMPVLAVVKRGDAPEDVEVFWAVHADELDGGEVLWSRPVGMFNPETAEAASYEVGALVGDALWDLPKAAKGTKAPDAHELREALEPVFRKAERMLDVWQASMMALEAYAQETLLTLDGHLRETTDARDGVWKNAVRRGVYDPDELMDGFFRRMGKGFKAYPGSDEDLGDALGDALHEAWKADREDALRVFSETFPEVVRDLPRYCTLGGFEDDYDEVHAVLSNGLIPADRICDPYERALAKTYWKGLFRGSDSVEEIVSDILRRAETDALPGEEERERGAHEVLEAVKQAAAELKAANRLPVCCSLSLQASLIERSRSEEGWPDLVEADFDQYRTALKVLESRPLRELFTGMRTVETANFSFPGALSDLAIFLECGRPADQPRGMAWGDALAGYSPETLRRAAADAAAAKANELEPKRAMRLLRDPGLHEALAGDWMQTFKAADSVEDIVRRVLARAGEGVEAEQGQRRQDVLDAVKDAAAALKARNRLPLCCSPALQASLIERSKSEEGWPVFAEKDFDQYRTAVKVLGSCPFRDLFAGIRTEDRTFAETADDLASSLRQGCRSDQPWRMPRGNALAGYGEEPLVRAAADVAAAKAEAGELGPERAERLLRDPCLRALSSEGRERTEARWAQIERAEKQRSRGR